MRIRSLFRAGVRRDVLRPGDPDLRRGTAATDQFGEDYYLTDAIPDRAIDFLRQHQRDTPDRPIFLFVAHFAPHWPLHALARDVAKYQGRFGQGWDEFRERRLERLVEQGILDGHASLSGPDPETRRWPDVASREWETRRMEVYAAQVDRMDRGVGRLIAELEKLAILDDTIVVFLSDNGGCAEDMPPEAFETGVLDLLRTPPITLRGEAIVGGNRPDILPGPETTFQSYGREWANLSNTPFREYKHWVHEGGIATPFIVRWPGGHVAAGRLCRTPAQLTDVMPTILEAAGAAYPRERDGYDVQSMEGCSLLPDLRGERRRADRSLFWEHEGNAAVRGGRWKLVKKHGQPWELYDIEADRAERNDVSRLHASIVTDLARAYGAWAHRCGVVPYERTLGLREQRIRRASRD